MLVETSIVLSWPFYYVVVVVGKKCSRYGPEGKSNKRIPGA